jgi:5-methylcytosine-specific restriction endonuclease McrA
LETSGVAQTSLQNDSPVCALCGATRPLTFHHLIPRKLHRRDYFRKNFSRRELARGIDICRYCHNGIHDRYDEMTLGKNFSTLDALRSDEALREHFVWAGRQKKI